MPTKPALVLFVYHRPQLTEQLIRALEISKPFRIYVVQDGPKPDDAGDARACAEVAEIITQIPWHARIKCYNMPGHLGCRDTISTGMELVLREEDCAIVLEDDCIPHPDFLPFCAEALAEYWNAPDIMAICGSNFGYPPCCPGSSVYFSSLFHGWGWATWRDRWRFFDVNMRAWCNLQRLAAGASFPIEAMNPYARQVWKNRFQAVADKQIDTWDFQWQHAIWLRHCRCVGPASNLVCNMGRGSDSTHMAGQGSPLLGMPTRELPRPWRFEPSSVHPNSPYDLEFTDRYIAREKWRKNGR